MAGGPHSPPPSSVKRSGYEAKAMTMEQIAKAIGSSMSTVYRYLNVQR